jgi:transcriptional regulator with XRE-family HTH domain
MSEDMPKGTPDVATVRTARRANPMDVHVCSRVRLRRILLGMSQEKLGESLGLTFQQIQKYEKGVNRIGASRLFDMSRVLGVSIQYFYEDAQALSAVDDPAAHALGFGERPTEHYMGEFLNSREGIELNRAFMRITDPKVRRSILELVRAMAGELPVAPNPTM